MRPCRSAAVQCVFTPVLLATIYLAVNSRISHLVRRKQNERGCHINIAFDLESVAMISRESSSANMNKDQNGSKVVSLFLIIAHILAHYLNLCR